MNKSFDLVELIAILTRYLGELEAKFLAELETAGITPRQLHYLDVIAELEHPNFSEVAAALQLSKPSVTAIFRKLAEGGYLERVDSDEDRRSAHIHLTKRGQKIVTKHDDLHRGIAALVRQNLSKADLMQMVDLLNKIVTNIS